MTAQIINHPAKTRADLEALTESVQWLQSWQSSAAEEFKRLGAEEERIKYRQAEMEKNFDSAYREWIDTPHDTGEAARERNKRTALVWWSLFGLQVVQGVAIMLLVFRGA